MLAGILIACSLLAIGVYLRARLRVIQWLFIPASVVGGLVGLVLLQIGQRAESTSDVVTSFGDTLRAWPGALIAVVFAGLLLERAPKRNELSTRTVAQAGLYAWIVILGQIVLGLLATWLVIRPGDEVPAAFGQLIEAGFAGGHSTAAALGAVFTEVLEFPEGLDLGLFMATIGLVYSVVSGIILVNIAVRRGWTRHRTTQVRISSGLDERRDPRPIAFGRIAGEVIDPFAFQLVLVGLAIGIGVLLQWGVAAAAGALGSSDVADGLGRLPLFLFALLGGWMLRVLMEVLGVGDLIDPESIKRIVAIAMEFLIVAAIASLRIEVVAAYGGPLMILCAIGFTWPVACLLLLAPRILPRAYWFELGIINYGMSTGTTAQGMMLLRIVDEDLESGAAEDYALAAPLSAPFVGGGVLTLSLPLILVELGMASVIVALLGAMVVFGGVAWVMRGGRANARTDGDGGTS